MNFYQKLPSFGEFSEITENHHYSRVPPKWWVVVADIKGSTQAVEEGRYKDVNTLGAAAIVVTHTVAKQDSFPFVFGGDGATMLIPNKKIERVKKQLIGLRDLARKQFDMDMRVGAIQVAELGDTPVEVAKLNVAGKRCLAVFRGGGLTKAEELIKAHGDRYEFKSEDLKSGGDAKLGRLSCRWLPIKPSRGHSLSLMVRSRSGDSTYQKVLGLISSLYDGDLSSANPINENGSEYRSIKQCLKDEMRYHQSLWSFGFAKRLFEIVCAVLIFKHGFPGPFSSKKYANSMGRHSDYRKFDDMLRMVIDCSKEQADQLQSELESMRQQGEIFYGLHLADESLMTCFFHGPGEGQHIHFVDGNDGGYAMAAKQLKNQLRQ